MRIFKYILVCIMSGISLAACDRDSNSIIDIPNTEIKPITNNNKVIYELNIRNHTEKGDFKSAQEDLVRLKELGVDIIWLMPIHPIGEVKRNGSLGSPYSVKDYKAINPDFGTEQDFKEFIATAHSMGIEIWLDWVANHTAWDHNWIQTNKDFYASKDGVQPYAPNGWEDVAQLDFSNPQLRLSMIDAMKYWVEKFDIDGYRCDAATFVPLSFWKEARQEVDKIKKITWLNEGDKPEYMSVFDYDYAWEFSNSLNTFGSGTNTNNLVEACKKLYDNQVYKDKGRMLYITNHDLNSHDGTEFTRFGSNVLPLTVLYYTIYDMPLIYTGQEIGMNKAMSLFDKDDAQWNPANGIYLNLFKKLSALKKTNSALEDGTNRGKLKFIETNKENVVVYSRKRGNDEVIVMLNFNSVAVNFKWKNEVPAGQFKNLLTNEKKSFNINDGVVMLEKGYAIFVK